MSKDIEEINGLLTRYENALNTGSADDAVDCFAPTAIIMAPHSPTRQGLDGARDFYDHLFSLARLDLRFEVQEVVPTAPDWAFGRSNSDGTMELGIVGAGPLSQQQQLRRRRESNQELYLFQKVGGEWKIARLSFCSRLSGAVG